MGFEAEQQETQYTQAPAYRPAHWASLKPEAVMVATRSVAPNSQANDGWRVEDVERELTLLGLIAMEDPPRPEVPSAIAACRKAGVRVVMVTGDHGLTAAAIGREIGLSDSDARVVTGVELDSLDDERLAALLDTR